MPMNLQARMPQKVERDPYTGPVVKIENQDEVPGVKRDENPIVGDTASFAHSRPPTRGGGRNLQDSSFALSGKHTNSRWKFWCPFENYVGFLLNFLPLPLVCRTEFKHSFVMFSLFSFKKESNRTHQNFTVAFNNACII